MDTTLRKSLPAAVGVQQTQTHKYIRCFTFCESQSPTRCSPRGTLHTTTPPWTDMTTLHREAGRDADQGRVFSVSKVLHTQPRSLCVRARDHARQGLAAPTAYPSTFQHTARFLTAAAYTPQNRRRLCSERLDERLSVHAIVLHPIPERLHVSSVHAIVLRQYLSSCTSGTCLFPRGDPETDAKKSGRKGKIHRRAPVAPQTQTQA